MKRITLASIVLLVLFAAPVLAEEAADHPLVGRLDGSAIQHQEISRFGEYTIAAGDDRTITVQGEIWMTLYEAPRDSSTFSVFSTYLSFLQAEGYEILIANRPGESSRAEVAEAYDRSPFADHGNYNHPAPFTQASGDAAAYISARRVDGSGAVYVSIAIAAGWYAYPQYKLDVVEVGTDAGRIVSTGTRPAVTADDAEPAERVYSSETVATERSRPGRFLSGNGSIRARSGMAAFMLLDPEFGGAFTVTDDGGSVSEDGYGFRNIFGPYAEVTWFANRNTGLAVDASRLASDTSFTSGDVTYQSKSELFFFRLSLVSRMIGADYPAMLEMGFGGGLAIVNLENRRTEGVTIRTLHATDLLPVIGGGVSMTIPIVNFVHLSGGLEYLLLPFGSLELAEADGTYSRTHYEGNLGGVSVRIGVVVEF